MNSLNPTTTASTSSNNNSNLMDNISNTINSLMPNKSPTKSKSKTVNENSLDDPVITSTEPYNASVRGLEKDLGSATPKSSDSNQSPGFLGGITELLNNLYFKILLLILILAFLGFNLFRYLANATDNSVNLVSDPLKKFLASIGFTVGEASKKIVNTSAKGTKVATDVVAGAADDAINIGEKALGVKNPSSKQNNNKDLNNAINKPRKKSNKQKSSDPEPDDAGSKTQSSKSGGKSGFCYIGEDRGFRSCIEVKDENTCMSGEIFPTMDICVNPTLRE